MLTRAMHHLRSQAVGYLALFVALGGVGAYAATQIRSDDIARNAVRGKHVKKDSLKGGDVKEATLAGRRCPSGTLYHEGACIETSTRPGAEVNWNTANSGCLDAGRRLPTYAELQTFRLRGGQDMSNVGEWTTDRYSDEDPTNPVTSFAGSTNETGVFFETPISFVFRYRCVRAPG